MQLERQTCTMTSNFQRLCHNQREHENVKNDFDIIFLDVFLGLNIECSKNSSCVRVSFKNYCECAFTGLLLMICGLIKENLGLMSGFSNNSMPALQGQQTPCCFDPVEIFFEKASELQCNFCVSMHNPIMSCEATCDDRNQQNPETNMVQNPKCARLNNILFPMHGG